MQTVNKEVFGISFTAQLPTTMDELKQVPGATDEKIAQAAIAKVIYHTWYTGLRSGLLDKLNEKYPQKEFFGKKEVTSTKDDDGKLVYTFVDNNKKLTDEQTDDIKLESNEIYIKRVMAENNLTVEQLAPLMQEVADATPFTFVQRERSAGKAKSLRKTVINTARGVFDKVGAERARRIYETISQKLNLPVAEFTEVEEDNILLLAAAISANEEAEKQAAQDKYANFAE